MAALDLTTDGQFNTEAVENFKRVFSRLQRTKILWGDPCAECGNADINSFKLVADSPAALQCVVCGRREAPQVAVDKPTPASFAADESSSTVYNGPSGRTEVADISVLRRADHVAWDRPAAYWHHAIVEHEASGPHTFDVIHYSGANQVIERETVDVRTQEGPLFRLDYPSGSHHPDVVLARAETRLGEDQYSMLWNNCEHFARWAKTGESSSDQSDAINGFLASRLLRLAKQIRDQRKEDGGREEFDVWSLGLVVLRQGLRTRLELARLQAQVRRGEISEEEAVRCSLMKTTGNRVIAAFKVGGAVLGEVVLPSLGGQIGMTLGEIIGAVVGATFGREAAEQLQQ